MAYLNTLEAETAPLTIDDLFNVNDYYGVRLFGDAWPDVKAAAALIAQKAANAPIMFYIRSFANDSTPGQHPAAAQKLWGYNDAAGVELLGAATWDAVKSEFDELLGWNIFSAAKSVVTAPSRVFSAAGKALEATKIPIISDVGTLIDKSQAAVRSALTSPTTAAERVYNAATGSGYNTAGEIATKKEKEAAAAREQMLKEQSAKAGAAASAAARAQAEYEAKLAAMEEAAAAAGLTPASAAANSMSATNTVLLVGGVGLLAYLLLRKKK